MIVECNPADRGCLSLPECLPDGRTGFTRALVHAGLPASAGACRSSSLVHPPTSRQLATVAGACRNLDAARFTRRRCDPASRPAIWCASKESDCRDSCWNRNSRDGGIMRIFSQLREFGQNVGPARNGPKVRTRTVRTGRPCLGGTRRSRRSRHPSS